jgi:hypothetical protein
LIGLRVHVASSPADSSSNLHWYERKGESVTDWKQHFQANPATMLGAAFGAGILLATMVGGGKKRRDGFYRSANESDAHRVTHRPTHKAVEAWNNITGAFVGVAATRLRDFVDELVPGIRTQLQITETKAE